MVSKRRDEISIGGVLHMESPNEPQRMTFVRAGTAATFALILGLYFVFAPVIGSGGKEGIWQPFLPEAELSKLVDDEVKIIQKELGKAKPDEKKIRASALVIALAAQDCKDRGEPGQLTMLRITALGLVQRAGKMELAEAKKSVERIVNYKKLEITAKPDLDHAIDLKKFVEELGDAMLVFEKTDKGGEGIERDLLILGMQKKPFTPAQMSDKLLIMADKAALIADVARAFDDLAKNQKKDWLKWTDEMRQGAIDLAGAVKAKNNKGIKTAINKLNSACFDCHGKFRDK
jgi:hypothetical protein